MSGSDLLQILLYIGVLLALVKPLATVYCGGWELAPERWIYRLAGVSTSAPMGWAAYAGALLASNIVGFVLVYVLLRTQNLLPSNVQGMGAVMPHTAFNIAVSFVTNTDWQNYAGESTLSYFTQMLGLTVQNFVSAASGMAVPVALAG